MPSAATVATRGRRASRASSATAPSGIAIAGANSVSRAYHGIGITRSDTSAGSATSARPQNRRRRTSTITPASAATSSSGHARPSPPGRTLYGYRSSPQSATHEEASWTGNDLPSSSGGTNAKFVSVVGPGSGPIANGYRGLPNTRRFFRYHEPPRTTTGTTSQARRATAAPRPDTAADAGPDPRSGWSRARSRNRPATTSTGATRRTLVPLVPIASPAAMPRSRPPRRRARRRRPAARGTRSRRPSRSRRRQRTTCRPARRGRASSRTPGPRARRTGARRRASAPARSPPASRGGSGAPT